MSMINCHCDDIIIEVNEEGIDGNGIANIELLSESGVVKTYRINFTNGEHFDFDVSDGSSIADITKTGTAGLTDTYTITLTNGDTTTFEVTNGMPCTHSWSGTVLTVTSYSGTSSADLKGEKGDKGDAATIAVGTVTTGEAGSAASVENVGTENDAVFDFVIPKGDKGDKGNLMYATFGIDASTGILSMYADDEYDGPVFQLSNGYLEVVI